jgi:hypothetical protein
MISDSLKLEYKPKDMEESLKSHIRVLGGIYDLFGEGNVVVSDWMDMVRLNPNPNARITQVFKTSIRRPVGYEAYIGELIVADHSDAPFTRLRIYNNGPYQNEFMIYSRHVDWGF